MQVKEIQKKQNLSSNKMKKYLLEDGTYILTQGYGVQFLDWYIKNNYNLSNLKSEFDCELFQYKFENKIKYYRPDFQINNKIIELKSNYTFEKEFNKNYEKFKSALDNNFELHLIIYNKKIDFFDIYIFYPDKYFSVKNNIEFYKGFLSITHCYKDKLEFKMKQIV
jgi:hypothetical protein